MRNNEEYISVRVALGPGNFDPGWAAGAFTGYISCAISQFLCFSHFCPIKIGADFFRLKLVNHLFEADLCCKLLAFLSGLSLHELLWFLSYFSHPGSVPCPSHGSLGIACLSLLQLFGIVLESGRVLQDFAGSVLKLSTASEGLDSFCVMLSGPGRLCTKSLGIEKKGTRV